jgi:arginine-tRNA-protein transferase
VALRVFQHFVEDARDCAYLPGETAQLEYRVMLGVEAEDFDAMLARGWRRFGPAYFRPRCAACSECVPIRIPVGALELTRSLRRVWNRRAQLEVRWGPPRVDAARLALYDRWHQDRSAQRGWDEVDMTPDRYASEFALPVPFARELSFEDADTGRLLAVSLVDETPTALSAVYTYHDPAAAKLSLGTLSILTQYRLAAQLGKRHLYLGYRVLGCASSRYKARFVGHELLEGWPEADEAPRWRFVESTDAGAVMGGAGRAEDGEGG